MKIAVISDTHIPARLQALPGLVYEACAESELIIHAGDIEERDVIYDLLRFAPVKVVRGNLDIDPYPEELTLTLECFKVCISHGSGAYHNVRERLRRRFNKSEPDIIIHGHTHIFHWKKQHNIWFLCPGAVANPTGSRSMAMLTLEKGSQPQVEKIIF